MNTRNVLILCLKVANSAYSAFSTQSRIRKTAQSPTTDPLPPVEIERAVHVKGLRCGDFPPLAVFIRGAAVAKAHAEIRRYNRIKKAERDQLEAEYEFECAEN